MKLQKAPKDIRQLKTRINKFLKAHDLSQPISPRFFRIYIGVSKQTLSNWKMSDSKREWFDLIKEYEDLLLAVIEQETIKLSRTDKDTRTNLIGLINTLRAYDREQYIPEFQSQTIQQAPIHISLNNKGNNTNQLAIPVKVKEKLNAE